MTNNRKPRPKEKKSEMLDVRLPFGLKQALVEACRKQGVTVSDTVRGLISEYVNATKAGHIHPKLKGIAMKIARNPLKTTGMTLASLAAFALMAAPSTADERLFASYDTNKDGQITETEIEAEVIAALDTNLSNSIELGEFALISYRETVTDKIRLTDAGSQAREIDVLVRVIDLSQPGQADFSDWGIAAPIPADLTADETSALARELLRLMKAHSGGMAHNQLHLTEAAKILVETDAPNPPR